MNRNIFFTLGRITAAAVLFLMASVIVIGAEEPGGGDWPPEPPGFIPPHLSPAGNRFLDVHLDVPETKRLRAELAGRPAWAAGFKEDNTYVWIVVLENGRVQRVSVSMQADGERVLETGRARSTRFSTAFPPVLVPDGASYRLMPEDAYAGNPLTFPVPAPDGKGTIAVTPEGRVVRNFQGRETVLAEDVLPDTRFIQMGTDLYFLINPTNRYRNGVLGDELEAAGFARLRFPESGTPKEQRADEGYLPGVIESLSLIGLPDLPGTQALVFTVSSPDEGSRILLADADGDPIAWGEPVGRGNRWRHQIAAAPLGPDGEVEIAVIKTPHIGGILEYYRPATVAGEAEQQTDPLSEDAEPAQALEIVHTRQGYSTHSSGSRNLSMAAVGDFDDDGRYDILLPNQAGTALSNVQRTASGSRENYRIRFEREISTSISVVEDKDWSPTEEGRRPGALAVGTADGILHIWVP
ncbi:MAG: hypothetical protein ACLFRY_11920 [Spirochaetia bacterium]